MNKELLEMVCDKYGIKLFTIDNFVDSSHGEDDIRYNYIINQTYVVKMNTTPMITERFLVKIDSLVDKYISIGLWCPRLVRNLDNHFLYSFSYENKIYNCYIEERAPYQFSDDEDIYILKRKMIGHLGKMATIYSNVDLVDNYSMWSIIDLNLLQEQIDEKQENLNDLVKVLKQNKYEDLANKLIFANDNAREIIKKRYEKLPRCVYQGDLNPSNILVDNDGDFVGLIDFNMFGTEVNINCFINESMYYMEKKDFALSIDEILDKANGIQNELLNLIFEEYQMNDLEKELFPYYKVITDISFYPNVQLWIALIEKSDHKDKVISLIERLVTQ